jgi:enolase
MKITGLRASVIFDSKARPTIRIDLESDRIKTFACAPSGTSVGKFEAQAFPNEGVEKAATIVNTEIGKQLMGLKIRTLKEVDDKLRTWDGTSNFSRIGGNTAMAISVAVAKALAQAEGELLCQYLSGDGVTRLPFPLSNIIGGGKHTSGDSLDFQEFLVVPIGAKTFSQAVAFNMQVHKEVGAMIVDKFTKYVLGRNDEGAWAAPLTIDEALVLLSSAIERVRSNTNVEGKIGIDMAASELWDGKKYGYKKEKQYRGANEQLSYVQELADSYDVLYIEDPFHEEDYLSFAELTRRFTGSRLVVGDDLIVTNPARLNTAINENSINGVIIKPNQIGTLTDVKMTVEVAVKNGIVPIASHRSGETTDGALAHIAAGLKCPIMKIGISGGERIEKINELMMIEKTIKTSMASAPLVSKKELKV